MTPDSPHSLRDAAGRRWPAPDGIPFLRAGREALAAEALARLDAGDREGALVLLLADQDDWWRGPTAGPEALRELVRQQARLSLREAMTLLAWGPVADYFAHRWSDPTFLAGLALVEAHWTAPRRAFELACGIGHHLRELARRGVAVTGTDVVFAKLWVARHWVCPEASLLCLDAAQDWPALGRFDLVACHDAFYFLEPKAPILEKLRGLGGLLAIGHVHNRDWANFSAGAAVTADAMAALLPDAVLYDDAELTRALAESRAPRPAPAEVLRGAEAFAAVAGPGLAPAMPVAGLLALPPAGAPLRRNPLYGEDGHIAWPSERYGREYGARATYPPRAAAPARAVLEAATVEAARRRELLDLPERW
ncbi:class I SAM-dependent methyltransferase [Paracraurococcus lichenis]|uniref:Class I SAM-dependent methyltransferase n=1 Tax=Paracraurococcus lichenis TaxID=3064888 RepID=A0ABT9E8A8_9PROT|nr:class I SAM-dependent methyltransferase [Paracraurococcus sp. LOR1-02]MDO9712185.1 class I SAM-dependent methyltransferase [Paracraurococcus sp. LOR1-02]